MDQNVKDHFEKAGFDVDGAIRRFGSNEALYEKYVFKFTDDKIYDNLVKAFTGGDMEAALREAHTLKGVSGNLGLNPLFEPVNTLMGALREGKSQSETSTLFAAVEAGYKTVINAINANKP